MKLDRREFAISALATGLFFTSGANALPRGARPEGTSKWALWYREPAAYWVESLPVGNGRLGAMVFGGIDEERLQLNEDTFWAGGRYDPASPEALEALPSVRELIFEEKWAEAQDLINEKMMARPLQQMPYQTLGDIRLRHDAKSAPSDYRRWLDLDTAEAVTSWKEGDTTYERRVSSSAADQVIIVRIKSSAPKAAIRIAVPEGQTSFENGTLWKRDSNTERRGIDGELRYTLGLQARGDNLDQTFADGELALIADGELVLVIAAATNYKSWKDVSGDPDAIVSRQLSRASRHDAEMLVSRQQAEHQRLFRNFELDLGADPFPNVATNERIRYSHEMGRDDPYLAALYVQYGRYLLISSSRPGSQPANLQGIWNESTSPPWDSKYTLNINAEMNYWPAERTGLSECVEPLIKMVEDLAESGARTAKTMYGARGWVTHHNTDLWRATAPIDGAFWGMWPMGGAWLCQHLWDRWEYSQDKAVLRRIYPLMRDAGIFFLDTMVEHPNGAGLVTVPSNSPENAHHPGVSVCAGPACDRQILRELFSNIIAASEILGKDGNLRKEFSDALARIPADRIGEAGQLQEWLEDWDMEAPEIQHRHVSHLYAVHPGHQIGPETPDLYRAASRSLAIRGDDATGWGIGWRINLWARLGNGFRAYTVLKKLLGPDRTYPNMFDAHPPFQIDGNFGGAAGVIEMLVRDRPQLLELMPAFPGRAWPEGYLKGVRLRGGLEMDMNWHEGKVTNVTFKAQNKVKRPVKYGDKIMDLDLKRNQSMTIESW